MITVVGGVYDELCFEPYWKQKFGSGLRACFAINRLLPDAVIKLHTFCDQSTTEFLKFIPFIEYSFGTIPSTIQFYYDYPLITPRIFPRPDTINKNDNNLTVSGENILYYGFIEGNASVTGNKVVYDPQSPIKPALFSDTKSQAKELCYVVNINEAILLTGSTDINNIKQFFFEKEKVSVLVLKMGPKGALVTTNAGVEAIIPVYKTNNVWPIGSGDVFAAVFSFHWFNTSDPIRSAAEASWQTACYCNSRDFLFTEVNSDPDIQPLTIKQYPTKLIYLAGPFFTFAERWLIDQIRKSLKDFNLNVFSPLHDVGHGIASEVVPKDLEALEKAAIVFAVLDGLDSGTLFEIGYAVKKGIPVIGYVENETAESVKMLEGTNCMLERDLTAAIYKCFWKLSENE